MYIIFLYIQICISICIGKKTERISFKKIKQKRLRNREDYENESMNLKRWILDKAVLTEGRQNFALWSELL